MKTTATKKPAAPALPASYVAAKNKAAADTAKARAAVDAKNKAAAPAPKAAPAVDNSPLHIATLHASAKLAQATNATKDALKALNVANGSKKVAAKAAFAAAERAESRAHKVYEAAKAAEKAAPAPVKNTVSDKLDRSAAHYAEKSNAHKAAAPAPILAPLTLLEQAKLKTHFDRLLAGAPDEILTLEELAAAVPPAYANRPGFESPKSFTRLLIGMGFVANPDEPKKSTKKAAPAPEPVKAAAPVKKAAPRRPTPAEVEAANKAARKAALAPKKDAPAPVKVALTSRAKSPKGRR